MELSPQPSAQAYYHGDFKNGRMDGRGTLTYIFGRVQQGVWKDDKPSAENDAIYLDFAPRTG